MTSKFGIWRRKITQHRVAIGLVAIVLVVVIVLIFVGYRFDWTGFSGYNKISKAIEITLSPPKITRTEEYQSGKTLWDWLQLLIIPLVLAIGGFWLSQIQKITEQRSTTDNQREAALQAYIDKISGLLLKEHLSELTADGQLKPEYDQVRKIARVQTITILFRLDARRIGYVFAFLREAELMSNKPNSSIVSLSAANLRSADLSYANLYQADLSGADLSYADLSYAHLRKANLRETILYQADLRGADLSGADLSDTHLSNAHLSDAILYQADLSRADLSKAILYQADLSKADLSKAILYQASLREAHLREAHLREASLNNADLSKADLSRADLHEAILYQADLSDANLKGAIGITIEELKKQAKSLQGTTMPDGSKHP